MTNANYIYFGNLDETLTGVPGQDRSKIYESLEDVPADKEVVIEYVIPADNISHTLDVAFSATGTLFEGNSCAFKQDFQSITSSIILTKGTTTSEANIELTGLVKFRDLSGEGTTEINGANIVTGTLSADKILGGTLQGAEIYITDNAATPNYYFSVDQYGVTNIQNAQQVNAENIDVNEMVAGNLSIEDTLRFKNYELTADVGASAQVSFYANYSKSTTSNNKYRFTCILYEDSAHTQEYYFAEPYNIYKEVTFGRMVSGELRVIKRSLVFSFLPGSETTTVITDVDVTAYPIVSLEGVPSLPGDEHVIETVYFNQPALAPKMNNQISLGGADNK